MPVDTYPNGRKYRSCKLTSTLTDGNTYHTGHTSRHLLRPTETRIMPADIYSDRRKYLPVPHVRHVCYAPVDVRVGVGVFQPRELRGVVAREVEPVEAAPAEVEDWTSVPARTYIHKHVHNSRMKNSTRKGRKKRPTLPQTYTTPHTTSIYPPIQSLSGRFNRLRLRDFLPQQPLFLNSMQDVCAMYRFE